MRDDTPSLPEVRRLVRRDGSGLVEQATDELIDTAIRADMSRPAATPGWLATMAGDNVEFNVLLRPAACRRRRWQRAGCGAGAR